MLKCTILWKLDPSIKYWDDRRSGRKRKCWDNTSSPVIPARDAGIWEFYQVGEHKSYVKMHHFMENWIPVSSTGMTKKGGTGTTGEGATWMTGKGVLG